MVRSLLALILMLVASPCLSQELRELFFYTDENEHRIDLPNPDCVGYLDDESNFKVEKKSDRFLTVIGLGRSDQSSTLLVDCPGFSTVFTLVYQPRSVHSVQETRVIAAKPEASAALESRIYNQGSRVIEGEIYDRSYDPFQITYRRGKSFDSDGIISEQQSIDIENRFAKNHIGYGVQDVSRQDGDQLVFRLNSQAFGVSASHARSINYNRLSWVDSSWVRLPSPIGLALGQELSSEGTRRQTVDRYFSRKLGSVNFGVSARFSRETSKDGLQDLQEFQFRTEQSARPRPSISISNHNSTRCASIKICQLSDWVVKSSISNRGTNAMFDYGIWPPIISAGISSVFFGGQRLNMRLSRTLKPNPWIEKWPHFTKIESGESLSESSGAHLEITDKKWTYFLDQSMSIIQGKVWSNAFGVRFEGEKIIAGLSSFVDGDDLKRASLNANIRYFFDANLNKVALKFSKTRLSIKVRSNVPGRYIAGARVDLRKNGQLVAHRDSSPDGLVEFTEARCCGDYLLAVEHDGFKSEETISFNPLSLDVSEAMMLKDHRKITVEFFTLATGSRYESMNFSNVYEEIGEPILSCAGCVYVGNDVYSPMNKEVSFEVNEALLPFPYKLDRILQNIDVRDNAGSSVVRVLLKRGRGKQ